MGTILKIIIIVVAFILVGVSEALLEEAIGKNLSNFQKIFIMGLFLAGVKYFWSFDDPKKRKKKVYKPT